MAEWRVGRSVGRTLYLDGKLVGLVDTPELAAEIVETMNRVGRLVAEVLDDRPAECCCAGCIGMGPCDDDLGKRDEPECDHPWHDGEDVTEHPACPRCGEPYAWSCCGSTDPEHLPSRCPRDAERRSEATPQKDLPLLVDDHDGCQF